MDQDKFSLLKSHVEAYTRKDGAVVQAHDDKRVAASPDLGPHKVGDTVSYKGDRGTRTGKVNGSRDGKVVVEHKAGYTELKHHSDLSAAGPADGEVGHEEHKKYGTYFKKGDKVKDNYGKTHDVIAHRGPEVSTSGGSFHPTKLHRA